MRKAVPLPPTGDCGSDEEGDRYGEAVDQRRSEHRIAPFEATVRTAFIGFALSKRIPSMRVAFDNAVAPS